MVLSVGATSGKHGAQRMAEIRQNVRTVPEIDKGTRMVKMGQDERSVEQNAEIVLPKGQHAPEG